MNENAFEIADHGEYQLSKAYIDMLNSNQEKLIFANYALMVYSKKFENIDAEDREAGGYDHSYFMYLYRQIKKIQRMVNQEAEPDLSVEVKYKWRGHDTEFIELFYSLCLTDAVKVKNKEEFLMYMASIFGIPLKNPFQKLDGMKLRNKDRATPLLNEMQAEFENLLNKPRRKK